MKLRNLLLISILVLLVCQLGFAQNAPNPTTALQKFAKAQATGKPMPVLPQGLLGMRARPTIWVSGQKWNGPNEPLITNPTEPWFCDYNNGTQVAICPNGLRTAYQGNFGGAHGGAGMVIAIVDFFAYPSAEANLAQFNADMNLPACTTANGCFTSVVLTPYDGTGLGPGIHARPRVCTCHGAQRQDRLRTGRSVR